MSHPYQGVGMHKDVESDTGFEADTSLHKRSGKKNEQNEFDDQGCLASNELLVLPSTPLTCSTFITKPPFRSY